MEIPPEYLDIAPKQSPDPMRPLRPGESWADWTREFIAHTEWELGLSDPEWGRLYGGSGPPPGYRNVLRQQAERLRRDLRAHFARLPWTHKVVGQAARVLHTLHERGESNLLRGLRDHWIDMGADVARVLAIDTDNIAWEIRDLVAHLEAHPRTPPSAPVPAVSSGLGGLSWVPDRWVVVEPDDIIAPVVQPALYLRGPIDGDVRVGLPDGAGGGLRRLWVDAGAVYTNELAAWHAALDLLEARHPHGGGFGLRARTVQVREAIERLTREGGSRD